jgi:hypothetical protein
MNDKKQLFLKVYANLPQSSRDEVIVVVEGEPYTWKSARLEIENDTQLGDKIIGILVELGIIQ